MLTHGFYTFFYPALKKKPFFWGYKRWPPSNQNTDNYRNGLRQALLIGKATVMGHPKQKPVVIGSTKTPVCPALKIFQDVGQLLVVKLGLLPGKAGHHMKTTWKLGV